MACSLLGAEHLSPQALVTVLTPDTKHGHPFPPHPSKGKRAEREQRQETLSLRMSGQWWAGTHARQTSIRIPNPGPSTATDHLGTAKARLEKVSGSCWHAASSWPGVSGVTTGGGGGGS